MKVTEYGSDSNRIAHIKDIKLNKSQDTLDLLGDMYFQGFNAMILNAENLPDDFFDLSSRVAGEILQKFSNYRMKLAIIRTDGEASKSLSEFMKESNKFGLIVFCKDMDEALNKLS